MRLILFKEKEEHSLPLFNELKIFNFKSNLRYQIGKFFWKIKNKSQPKSILKVFHNKKVINTRQDFFLPQTRTNIINHSIYYEGIKIWNDDISRIMKNTSSAVNYYKKHIAKTQGFSFQT